MIDFILGLILGQAGQSKQIRKIKSLDKNNTLARDLSTLA